MFYYIMENFTILNKTCCFIAKRNSGKSVLLKHLVEYESHKFSKIFVICPTERINRFYSDIVPQNCIFDYYEEEWCELLISSLTNINANKSQDDMKHVLLILDDCIADLNFHSSKTLKNIYTRGRHYGLSILVTTQHLNSLSPLIRSNSDWCLVGQQNKMSCEVLYQEFCSGNLCKKEFFDMFYKSTINFNFLLINCSSVQDSNIDSIYGKIRTPNFQKQEYNETQITDSEPTLWNSIFGEENSERKTQYKKKKIYKPVIKSAFD